MTLKTQVVTITPAKAVELLEHNTTNRPPKGAAIKRYAEDMRHGRWVLNGEAIIVREDGVLLNGQNRLFACVEADTPFETLVVTGVDGKDALDSIDIGQSRTLGDQLHWRGVSNAATVAAAVRWAWRYDEMIARGTNLLPSQSPARDLELAYFDRHRKLFDAAASTIIPQRRRIPGPQSVPMFVHFLISRAKDLGSADSFYNEVAFDTPDEGAAFLLKDWLLNHNTIGSRPPIIVNAAVQVKAARYWLNNEIPRALLWKRGGDKGRAEAFPRIDGEAIAKSTARVKRRKNT